MSLAVCCHSSPDVTLPHSYNEIIQIYSNYCDHFIAELKTHIRRLDHETTDLKFLNNQYVHKVRCLEKDSKAKAERIQQLQEKNMQAVVQTPGTFTV